MAATAAQVRKGRKFDQVLTGARDIFMRDGFEGASVDDIARAAGVSKATLYSYFPDKRLLFMEVATLQCQHQSREAMDTLDLTQPPRVVLSKAANTFLGFLLSEMGQRIFRICVGEADRFPELGRQFYNCGPMTMRTALVNYITSAIARGELVAEDPELAADQFAEMCKADLWPKLLFGIRSDFTREEIARVVDGALETFMSRYGA
ncbi:TetR/AcrR family transcriptional regulator [Puniceibacterium sp. IMCC21224]|uniref:TetR/AcrR family transcriptional regulator n=1 Tax=Puniceibacterium sp. IMCC21224 TaxID=1618204 RepID=UPI00064DB9D4|nr:TetR/AcrR family transcriptional regulator [Puniceibacterium sp. IMCC21224]KMK65373.1 transcriptional regulator, TetR family [Puniceibacterium sp. IMCC21224]